MPRWWERGWFVALLMLLAAVPLMYPAVPPLVDLLGHVGRYRVELDVGRSPSLARYYAFHWAAIGNLGVDLLIVPLARLVGLEPAVKLVVMLIPPLTVAGFLWVARDVHGRIPPTALFALPFALGHPFLFGFVNFALSMALAFLAFGLWLSLTRMGRLRLRAILFVPISIAVFFAHTYGWGVLGLLCFSAEAVRAHDKRATWVRAGASAAKQASVLTFPLVVMIAWRGAAHGGSTGDWFNLSAKVQWVVTSLRDRWDHWDFVSVMLTLIVIVEARRSDAMTFSRNLVFSALVLLAGFLVLPRIVFGSAYADMRLIPYVIAVGLLAIRFVEPMDKRRSEVFAVLGLAFYVLRIGSTTASLALAANDQETKLQALSVVPTGARVATLVGAPCGFAWPLARNGHLGSLVIDRRRGFANDQWVMEGMNLLELRYTSAGHFGSDPSENAWPEGCGSGTDWSINHALRALPRDAFDYLWLINPPPYDPTLTSDLRPVWRGSGSVLYQLHP